MDEQDLNSHSKDGAHALLERLARTLGCEIETFWGPRSNVLRQTTEMINLWLLIEDEQDRRKALAYVRAIAAKAPLGEAA